MQNQNQKVEVDNLKTIPADFVLFHGLVKSINYHTLPALGSLQFKIYF